MQLLRQTMEKRLFFISSLYLTPSYGSQMSELSPPCANESQDSVWTQRTFSGLSSEQLGSGSVLSPNPTSPPLNPSSNEGIVKNVPSSGLAATTASKTDGSPLVLSSDEVKN